MSLATRTLALLGLVEQERARQCAALLDDARGAADAQRAASRAEARQRLHEAFAEERTRTGGRLAAAHAELRTRQRVHAQRHLEARLALAWERLPQVLVARWHDAAARGAWVELALADAGTVLAPGPWLVTHAPGWPLAERSACQRPPLALQFTCDDALPAGLRITAAGNVLDATLAGLLADRAEIGGRLVGLLEGTEGAPR
jgi:hypothetical protein